MAIVTKPHGDFVNNVDVANATYVDDQFNTLYNLVNGNLDSTNVKSAAAIAGVTNPWGDNTAANRSAASAYQSTAQSLSAGVTTKLQYQTKNWDYQTEYDNTTNYRFTSKKGGTYLVTASMYLTNPASNDPFTLAVYKNGSQYAVINNGVAINGANYMVLGSTVVQLNANDYVEIYGYSAQANTLITGSGLSVTQIA